MKYIWWIDEIRTRMKLWEYIDAMPELDREPRDAVIIHFGRFGGWDALHKLDERLCEHIPEQVGRHDGHEVAIDDSHGTLFTYGENAETLFKTMQPILKEFDFLNGARVHLEFKVGKEEPLEIEFEFYQTGHQEATNN